MVRKEIHLFSVLILAILFISCNPLGSGLVSQRDNSFLAQGGQELKTWGFDAGTVADYTLDPVGTLDFTAGVCRLVPLGEVDNNNTGTGLGGGSGVGVDYGLLSDATSHGLKLANHGGCDATSTNCSSLNSSWTPKYSSLIHYWKLDGNLSDSVGTSHGTNNGLVFVPGQIGGAATSSAAPNYGTAPYTADFNSLPMTISLWVKPNTVTNATVIGNYVDSSGNGWDIFVGDNGKFCLYYFVPGGSIPFDGCMTAYNAGASIGSYIVNEWNHLTVVITNSGVFSCVNGVCGPTISWAGTANPPTTIQNIAFGAYWIGAGSTNLGFPGSIDDVAIWSTNLSPTEIGIIYDRQYPKYSGTFSSRIMNAYNPANWTTLSWIPTLPFSKALPDYSGGSVQNEIRTGGYTSLFSDGLMNGNIGLWHFNEAAGNFFDTSGTGNDLVPHSVVQNVPGIIDSSVHFNGTSSYVITPASITGLNIGASSRTSSIWFKCPNVPSSRGTLFGQYNLNSTYYLLVENDGSLTTYYRDQAGVAVSLADGTNHCDGRWHHAVTVLDRVNNLAIIYLDGVDIAHGSSAALGSIDMSTRPLQMGAFDTSLTAGAGSSDFLEGYLDEAAVWDRALDPAEIAELYQRGAARVKFQIRSCNDNTCAGEAWQGPDGTNASYFSEAQNRATQAATSSGSYNTSLPLMTFANFTNPPISNQYFQYRVILESDSSTSSLMPELKSVSIGGPTHYSQSSTVYGNNGAVFTSLASFSEVATCASGISYNLSLDKVTWYYWNGTTWAASNGTTAQSNLAAVVNAHISSFSSIGTGTVYFKAFLNSNGTQPCSLDLIQVSGK